MRVLVVEDATKLATLIARGLREDGLAVDVVGTGSEAVWMATEHDYDAVVLDVMLPDRDGFTVCHELRSAGRWAPVLMLTALDAVADRVRGLDVGADDYLVKPFAFDELSARLRALVRRGALPRPSQLQVGDLVLEPATREVRRGATSIALTAKEFSLLEHLMRQPGTVVSRAELLAHAWDFAFDGDPHVLTVYLSSLRDKVDRPFGRRSIETLRRAGYRIRDDTA